MDDPGILYFNDESTSLYRNGGRVPIAAFSKAGGEHPYIDPIVIRNLAENHPPVVKTTPVQTAVLTMLTVYKNQSANSDLMCVSETGSGKTFAFLLPAIQTALNSIAKRPNGPKIPSVLIFCHSMPLAESIFERAIHLTKRTPIKTVLIAGKTEFLRSNEFDIAICSAGRFRNHFEGHKNAVQIDVSKIELLIIDEVDASVDSTEDLFLYNEIRKKTSCPAYFFSATLDASFNINLIFREENNFCFQHGELNTLPDTVRVVFWECNRSSFPEVYLNQLGDVVSKPKLQNGFLVPSNPSDMLFFIIQQQLSLRSQYKFFVFTRKTNVADFLALKLAMLKIPARSVHAKKSVDERRDTLQKFNEGTIKVLVGSNQITRGIDCDVHIVINYDVPTSHTAWIHRSGRVGRNGKKGAAITFIDPRDGDLSTRSVVRQIVEKLPTTVNLPPFLIEYVKF